jgi:hypothetical protein
METNELILLRLNHLYFFKRALAKKEKQKNDTIKLNRMEEKTNLQKLIIKYMLCL